MNESEEWDKIVCSFADYDVYWLSGYVKAFYLHGDGTPLLFFFTTEKTRGINVVMKRDISKDSRFSGRIPCDSYYDFSTPYGYGGWLIEGDRADLLFQEYAGWLNKHRIISEFIRFHPMLKNHICCDGFYNISELGEVVHMSLSSREMIWNNITSKNRNVIRKAIKNDVKVYNGRFPEIYEQFREIYNMTMERDAAEEYYYFGKEFYQSVLEDLPQQAQVFYAEKDKRIVAAAIILAANGKMNYHLSGSLQEYSSLAPTNLLLYQAALWGCANQYQTFYLGGGVGSGEDSLFRFKRAFFKGALNRFYIGKKIYDQDKYDELISLREPTDSGYFPKYRA